MSCSSSSYIKNRNNKIKCLNFQIITMKKKNLNSRKIQTNNNKINQSF